ncbi:hypothetical protein [Aureimonas sp. AU20]|uniref:hypothetical protein n=1 Tax=Aureimonas sp. AU20 TaxID=1349819 RepID=UPI0007229FAF|nr:hypothetical protein [Aureimonas sp. AU20]ALN75482.1 hypothetical protein M673_22330 [Aureimonas sp. AU20]
MRHHFMGPAIALGLSTALVAPAFALDGATQPAPAEAGTTVSAARLKSSLAALLTNLPFDKRILRVEPDPNGQRITIDPAAALSEMQGVKITFAPLSFIVSERPDGTWNVFGADPVAFSTTYDVGGQAESFAYRQESQLIKGIYSPELATFLSAEGQAGATTTHQSDAVNTTSDTKIAQTRIKIDGAPAGNGAADIAFTQVYDTVTQATSFTIPAGEDGEPLSLTMDMGAKEIETRGAAKAARTRPLLDLYTLVIANVEALDHDAKATLAGPFGTELKDKLRAILPLWASLEGGATAKDVSLAMSQGKFRAEEASQSLRLSGVATDSTMDMELALRGIAIETPFMPPWGASLSPDLIEIGVAVSGADLATPVAIALDEADFTQDPPLSPEAQAKAAAAFAPERIQARIKPSRIHSRDLDIAFSGDMSFASGAPDAKLAIDAAGLDTVIGTLQGAAADDPSLHQAVGMLQFAKGLSKPKDGGRLEWLIEAAADGSIKINGTMIKGPDEATDPEGLEEDAPLDETTGDEPPAKDAL